MTEKVGEFELVEDFPTGSGMSFYSRILKIPQNEDFLEDD